MNSFVPQLKYVLSFSALFCLLAAVALTSVVSADESGTTSNTISHSPSDEISSSVFLSGSDNADSENNNEYISPVFTTNGFNGLGLTWQTNHSEQIGSTVESDIQVSATVRDDDDHGEENITFFINVDDQEWIELPMMGHEGKNQDEALTSHPLFIDGSSVQYKIIGSHINVVRNVRITHFDSTAAPNQSAFSSIKKSFSRTLNSTDAVEVVSREEWGAEESYHTWTGSAVDPKAIIIHHTAGGNGKSDPEAIMRGIYYWHAVVLGWGDIGYNYVISNDGTIFEGRARLQPDPVTSSTDTTSGSVQDVIGAHAYNSHEDLNYNTKTIGIAIMGCYENTAGACNNVHTISNAADDSLTSLLAKKALEHNIVPKTKTKLFGEKVPTIIGHRDVDYIYCPGNTIHSDMATIRQDTLDKYTALQNETSAYQASYTDSTLESEYTLSEENPLVTVEYTNTGTETWDEGTVKLQVSTKNGKRRQGVFNTEDVAPGESTTFSLEWSKIPNKSKTYTVTSRLLHSGERVKKSKQQFQVAITNPYVAEIVTTKLPVAIQYGWKPTATITLRNTGEVTWPAGSSVKLNGKTSRYLNREVKPGQQRKFKVQLNPNGTWKSGNKHLTIKVKTPNSKLITGSTVRGQLRID